MTYNIFSTHAPTGESATRVASTNEYSTFGRTIGYPNNFDLYTRHISDSDGSQAVVESRTTSELIGSRLYLHHRPLIASDGSITSITVSDGTIDTSYTNSTQAYIVFSSLPTADFTVSYVAVPDCDLSWSINKIQDSIMEIEQILGPTNDATYPGIRNLHLGLFDNPTGQTASGVAQNAVYLTHLDQNIVIASSDDATLKITRGASHTIQLGRQTDNIYCDVTGFLITQTNGSYTSTMIFGTKTGDKIYWKGSASGAGQLTIGGPEWTSMYSGVTFSTALTGSFYTGALLRVHGDAAFMGDVKAYGNITIVNATGTTSTVLGDWTIRDELFVYGVSHLIGDTEVNKLTVYEQEYISKDIIALNNGGNGGNGQSLVDNLDCSEVAWNYNTVISNYKPNTIISAPLNTNAKAPKKVTYRPWMSIGPSKLVGDVFSITGALNAAASSSGAHPNILQLLMNVGMVSGTYTTYGYGFQSGIWSPGMMDPGAMSIKMLDGQSQGLTAPIYGYTVEQTGTSTTLTRLNVFLPEAVSAPPQTNDKYMLYNPYSVEYNTITVTAGATPTFVVNASTTEPLAISFEDEVRIMTSNSSSSSLTTALVNSVSGLGGSPVTGIAYIFADSNYTDPENPPIFKARANPYRMPGQTAIGEVVASYDGATWSTLETISYRPKGIYDSAWIPMYSNLTITATSGRCTPGFSSASTAPLKVYFHHYLGSDIDIGKINADLYLGAYYTGSIAWNKTHTPMYSFFGQDSRVEQHGLSGSIIHVPLGAKRNSSAITERDASIFYLDSALIGIDISPGLAAAFPTGGVGTTATPQYLRLIVRKDN